jgi:hypothetical protein
MACLAPPADAILFVEPSKYGEYPRHGIEICDEKLKGL